MLRKLLVLHGYSFVFGYLLAVQAGLPIPADPMMLVMGAMVGEGRYSLAIAVLVAVAGAMIGDLLWYELGRVKGHSIIKVICRLTIEPDTCVRKTEDTFGRRGAKTLLFSKFVPGMSLVSTPMAGMIRMPRWKFLLWDGAGCLIWVCSYMVAGMIFHKQIQFVIDLIAETGKWAGLLVLGLLGLYIGYKTIQRQRYLHAFRVARITPTALFEKMTAGSPLTIVDLRHPMEFERDGVKLTGALVLRPDELKSRANEIPRDREIVLYCSCPNEVTSTRVALLLRQAGLRNVRPLEGGIDAWRTLGFPVEPVLLDSTGVPALV